MGRRRDTPETQAAKGFPSKRRTKTERQIDEAEKLAALISAAPAESGDRLAPPTLLTDPRCAGALTVWREYAPKLAKLNLFTELDRHTFSIFCVYAAEFAAAQLDIMSNGYSTLVKTISGDKMPRINPSVKRRDRAQAIVLEMSTRFGLTPVDYYRLVGQQSAAPAGSLFAQGNGSAAAKTELAVSMPSAPDDDGPIGMLGKFDSAPPRPN
jgi:P27 family predicted phage terminase small subunit